MSKIASVVAEQMTALREEMRCELRQLRSPDKAEQWEAEAPLPQRPPRQRVGPSAGTRAAAAAKSVPPTSAAAHNTVPPRPREVQTSAGAPKGTALAAWRKRPAEEPPKAVTEGGPSSSKKKKKKKSKGKKQWASSPTPPPPAAQRPAPLPQPPPRSAPTGEVWAKVVGRKEQTAARKAARAVNAPPAMPKSGARAGSRRQAAPPTPAVRGGASAAGQSVRKKVRPARAPRTAAITLTADGEEEGALAKAMAKLRREISLADFDIEELRPKRAMTGGLILEVPGPEGAAKADRLARRMDEVLEGTGIRVARPMKRAEVRVHGLDDSVTEAEVRTALAQAGGCTEGEVKVGVIRSSPSGLGSVWAQAPLVAVRKYAASGKVRIGWVMARTEVLATRPMQCFRCLETGHTRQRCTSGADRSGKCYRCGQGGHKASECSAGPRCPLCTDLGRPAEHRLGAPSCAPAKKRRAAPPPAERVPKEGPPPVAMEIAPGEEGVALPAVDLQGSATEEERPGGAMDFTAN